jgi:hypothetical protein
MVITTRIANVTFLLRGLDKLICHLRKERFVCVVTRLVSFKCWGQELLLPFQTNLDVLYLFDVIVPSHVHVLCITSA